jgi:site-specific DNA-methyltransferase (adenine-specific)
LPLATKYFPKKHDTIFFYTKSEHYTFNIQRGGFTEAQLKRYNHMIDGERYANMKGKMRKLEGGAKIRDWWDLPITQSPEREGYPTQKPLALLKRIIEASSNVGDVVLDPFCGCATTCVAAQQLGRKWIGIDIEKQAVKLLIKRLSDDAGLFTNFIHLTTLPQRTDVERMDITPQTKNDIKKRLFKEQGCKCNGCNDEFEIRHFEVDHIVPKAKGGGDYYENYQLLCSSCNRIKGDRPMEYLRMKMRKIEEVLLKKLTFGE